MPAAGIATGGVYIPAPGRTTEASAPHPREQKSFALHKCNSKIRVGLKGGGRKAGHRGRTMTAQAEARSFAEEQHAAFCGRLHFLRIQAGLSQEALARRIGVNAATYSGWEKGSRRINLEAVYHLAAELGCGVTFLVVGDGVAASPPGVGEGKNSKRPPVSYDSLVGRVSSLEAAVFGSVRSFIDAATVKAAIEENAAEKGAEAVSAPPP